MMTVLTPLPAPDLTPCAPPISATEASPALSPVLATDLDALSVLHDSVFGPGRFARTAYRIREGAPLISDACRKFTLNDRLIGAVQMTWVTVGDDQRGMLLGPLAVDEAHENLGYGKALVEAAVAQAEAIQSAFVILVGDLAYYQRTGFQRVPPGRIVLPGPVDLMRLLIRPASDALACPEGALRALPHCALEGSPR